MAKRAQIGSNGNVGERLLTTREAAEYLGLAEGTVYKKSRLSEVRARELPFATPGPVTRPGRCGA
jgi:excisionase family DNA binding protein